MGIRLFAFAWILTVIVGAAGWIYHIVVMSAEADGLRKTIRHHEQDLDSAREKNDMLREDYAEGTERLQNQIDDLHGHYRNRIAELKENHGSEIREITEGRECPADCIIYLE